MSRSMSRTGQVWATQPHSEALPLHGTSNGAVKARPYSEESLWSINWLLLILLNTVLILTVEHLFKSQGKTIYLRKDYHVQGAFTLGTLTRMVRYHRDGESDLMAPRRGIPKTRIRARPPRSKWPERDHRCGDPCLRSDCKY